MDHTLVIGRIVHYRLEWGPHKGDYRPAIVVQPWGESCANLQVFLDGSNDTADPYAPPASTYWATSRLHGHGLAQWLWPDELKPQEVT